MGSTYTVPFLATKLVQASGELIRRERGESRQSGGVHAPFYRAFLAPRLALQAPACAEIVTRAFDPLALPVAGAHAAARRQPFAVA